MTRILLPLIAASALIWTADARPAAQPPDSQQQPSQVVTTISSESIGTPPRFAVPPFIALSKDAETVEAAKLIAEVLWDDLNFEREFALVPRDVYATIPAATSMFDVPLDRWREVNADGVVIGTLQKVDGGVQIEVRLFNVRSRNQAFGQQYKGPIANPRIFAHQISDDIHQQQRALRGVARTKLTFNSDRDGERMAGTIEQRNSKEIYISDYDGFSQRRVTTGFSLNVNSTWSPNGRSIAYASWIRGLPNIFVSHIYEGTRDELTKSAGNNTLPVWSPDGTRIAFSSTRDHAGNTEIYVMNADGSNLRRLTTNPAIDTTPTWSPTGTQIAFVSDRRGAPQIWIMSADGLGQQPLTSEYSDRPTWSPAPYNEIAFAARTGPGFDIKILDLATREVRQLTFGEGTNESPAFSPNGRHLAFSSTRSGKFQIFTMSRDGKNIRQITRNGSNFQPDWSR
jgi:TolB protein